MNFDEAIQYLYTRRLPKIKQGLSSVKALLACFGNPQASLKAVHVAGTNGKGSTCAYLESVFRYSRYQTGLFTSPYLLSPLEMIKVNNVEIDETSFSALVSEASAFTGELDGKGFYPTEYEILTVIALEYFKRQGCDIVIIETAMGGTLDCTNVLEHVEACVITKISYDHTEFLGNTLADISSHKAGIMKPGVPVITWPQENEALAVIGHQAQKLNAPIIIPDFNSIQILEMNKLGSKFTYKGLDFSVNLPGEHQINNVTLAVETCQTLLARGWQTTYGNIHEGLSHARWPGRFELLGSSPDFILDCGHNYDGVEAFVKTFKSIYPDKKATIIFGVMQDKDYDGMLRLISSIADNVLLVQPRNPRALPLNLLKETADKYCRNVWKSDTIEAAIKQGFALSDKGIICALGSIYYAGEIREKFGLISSGFYLS